jgi:hypothetical protein
MTCWIGVLGDEDFSFFAVCVAVVVCVLCLFCCSQDKQVMWFASDARA